MPKHFIWFLLPAWASAIRTTRPRRAAAEGSGWVVTAADSRALAKSEYAWHGTFRDLSVWRGRASKGHDGPDSQLWVVEYTTPEQVANETARAESLNVTILFNEAKSVVYQGDVPATLGYDACGSMDGKAVIPVAPDEIEIKPMPQTVFEKYSAVAQQKDPQIERVLSFISRGNLERFTKHLADYGTRHSDSGLNAGLDQSADWAANVLGDAGWTVTRDDFQPGGGWFSSRITPQIIAERLGEENPNRFVIIGAHLDSIAGRFAGVGNAPGADDNGSGSSAVLELARMITESGVKFKHSIRLVLFTGEEQGLRGSRAIARRWKADGVDIMAMLNMDMLGYQIPNTPISVNVMTRNADQGIARLLATTAQTYFGDKIAVGETSGCCSDQQAFYEQGFPACGVFESPGSRVYYPEYHKTTDLVTPQNINFEQVEYQASTVLATAMAFAELL